MKTLSWFVMAVFLGGAAAVPARAEKVKKSDVPQAVLAALASRYPKAKVRAYLREKEKDQVTYELETRDGDVKRDIVFAADGSILEMEEGIRPEALPEPVRQTLTTKYPKAKIKSAEKITRGSTTAYEIALKQGKKTFEKVLDAAGQEQPAEK